LLFLQHKRLAFFYRERILKSPSARSKVYKADTHSVIGWRDASESQIKPDRNGLSGSNATTGWT